MMLALLVIPFAVQAQKRFHDVEIYDAKGPVSAISFNILFGDKTKFSKNGKLMDIKNAVYDANGYLQYYEYEKNRMLVKVTNEWKNGKLKKQITEWWGREGKTVHETANYYYNKKGEIVKVETISNGVNATVEYSNYKYDSHGNWVRRTVSAMNAQMEQERIIEYYH